MLIDGLSENRVTEWFLVFQLGQLVKSRILIHWSVDTATNHGKKCDLRISSRDPPLEAVLRTPFGNTSCPSFACDINHDVKVGF